MARDGIADFAYVNPGYQPGRFPIIAAGEMPFLIGNAKGGTAALDAWYRAYAPTGNEGRAFLLRLRAGSRHLALPHQEDRAAGGHQGHEDPPGQCDDG